MSSAIRANGLLRPAPEERASSGGRIRFIWRTPDEETYRFAALLPLPPPFVACRLCAVAGYPSGTITVVVPLRALAARPIRSPALVAESMSKDLGQQIIVENVGGAGGTLGAGRVAQADPDGYTLLLHHIGMATSATLYRKLPTTR